MTKKWTRRLPYAAMLLVVVGLVAYGFWPRPVQVDVAQASRGSLQVTVDDDGKTRIREKYIVSVPVYGKLFRLELEEGDLVRQAVSVLARIEPSDPALLDARARAEAEARVRSAEASVRQAEAASQRANEASELAEDEYDRAASLIESNAISRSEYDRCEHVLRMARADVRSRDFSVAVARFELELAQAALIRTHPPGDAAADSGTLTITSPVDGRVLRIFKEDAGVVKPGTQLLEIGDLRDLEMEIDVLSTEAVKVRPGAAVFVEHWGGNGELEGTVRLVEPSAFEKVSSLGVEEQRVNVIADFNSPFEQRSTLGDGYRIEARIVVDEVRDAVIVPAGTLFREGDAWHLFKVLNGRAALQPVKTGVTNGLETQILSGVSDGDLLVLHPTDQIRDGVRVLSVR